MAPTAADHALGAPRRPGASPGADPGGGPASPAAHRIVRHRALPSGRALVGALLVTVAALGAFALAAGRSATHGSAYVVATRAVAPGARLDADALETRMLTLDPDVAATAFVDPQRLVGAVALGPIAAGQLISQAGVALPLRVDGAPRLGHEFSFPVSRDRVPPGLRRGEQVAVLATYGTGADARTVTTVQGATVVDFDSAGDAIGTRSEARLTLLLPDASSVVETAHASQVAELTVVRTTQASTPLPTGFKPTTAAK